MVANSPAPPAWQTDAAYRAWQAGALARLRGVAASVRDRPRRASWVVAGYGGSLHGFEFRYATGRDLTADILERWLDHRAGGTPPCYLGDLIAWAGPLWDWGVVREAWGE